MSTEPNSIVHQVLRSSRKIYDGMSRNKQTFLDGSTPSRSRSKSSTRRLRRSRCRKGMKDEFYSDDATADSTLLGGSDRTDLFSLQDSFHNAHGPSRSCTAATLALADDTNVPSSVNEDFNDTEGGDKTLDANLKSKQTTPRTINQIDFLSECLLSSLNRSYVVHFVVEGCPISDLVDKVMSKMWADVAENDQKAECVRISARLAPLITAKMKLDPTKATVIVLNNGVLKRKIDTFSFTSSTDQIEKFLEDSWRVAVECLSSISEREDTPTMPMLRRVATTGGLPELESTPFRSIRYDSISISQRNLSTVHDVL